VLLVKMLLIFHFLILDLFACYRNCVVVSGVNFKACTKREFEIGQWNIIWVKILCL
jgi:hypothetical protein